MVRIINSLKKQGRERKTERKKRGGGQEDEENALHLDDALIIFEKDVIYIHHCLLSVNFMSISITIKIVALY